VPDRSIRYRIKGGVTKAPLEIYETGRARWLGVPQVFSVYPSRGPKGTEKLIGCCNDDAEQTDTSTDRVPNFIIKVQEREEKNNGDIPQPN